mmetsp:Transcript_13572/g.26987  ORF Transcript_13572/g.26987 Transcript_13572/m.26987 type:complete len:138 (-) Transcript_13572:56-469(-)
MTSFNLFPNHISQKATIRVISSDSDAFSIPPLAYISHAPFLSNERPIPMRFADFVDLPRLSTANSLASEFEVFYIRSQSMTSECAFGNGDSTKSFGTNRRGLGFFIMVVIGVCHFRLDQITINSNCAYSISVRFCSV